MRENVVISFRGASYQIGRGEQFYGIWPAGATEPQPLEWWPVTPEGWSGAWSRFTSLEKPGSISPVASPARPAAEAGPPGSHPRTVAAVGLLALGVALGIAGLFPTYLDGLSLARQADEVVPHAIYFAAWAAGAGLIWLGGVRQRIGALLSVGVSAVTFGFFFADLGTPISGGLHLAGAGLWLGLLGWLACAAGSVMAFRLQPAGRPGRPHSDDMGPVVMLMLAAVGTAIAFAPSWDRYVLRIATGASQTFTAGNAFSNAAPVIVGNVVVMVAVVAVVAAAALWRPTRLGAALLAGAIIPMAAEAISALVQVAGGVTPEQFGYTQQQAAASGLTISSGVTAAFWIYCAFLVALIASFAWMLIPPHSAAADGPRLQQGGPAGAQPPSPADPETAAPDTAGAADVPSAAEPPSAPEAPEAPEGPGVQDGDHAEVTDGTSATTVAPIVGTVVPRAPSPESAD